MYSLSGYGEGYDIRDYDWMWLMTVQDPATVFGNSV
jgi:hypothetical protein